MKRPGFRWPYRWQPWKDLSPLSPVWLPPSKSHTGDNHEKTWWIAYQALGPHKRFKENRPFEKIARPSKGQLCEESGQNRCLDKVASGQEARSWPGKTLPGSLAHTQTKISRTTNRSSLPFPFMPEYVHKQYGKARHSIAHLGAPQDRNTTRSIFYHVKWHLA